MPLFFSFRFSTLFFESRQVSTLTIVKFDRTNNQRSMQTCSFKSIRRHSP